ncbi:hypothetical protein ABFS82_04G120900 [Erythranthe guttata]|uniref:CASP-like protein n=1 Tax=Erythranthe guttata TaxID=4155 RepID=A0A022RSQ7_ERYGU|nr:PREDICTED: CASP-like protein 1F1 [Erythranthe guttata]EYU43016.1 hypothetical protein MIMGU_mgv1a014654mg [Erythranthe guttata]|eukprot:XP_012830544.1 PREDICTED: CASP-like protein 1F1 [Erythranthe guttata]
MAIDNKSLGIISSPLKNKKLYLATQISLRVLAVAFTLAAALLMISSKETKVLYSISVDSKYSYSPAFKFLAYANFVAFGFSILSLIVAFGLGKREVNSTNYFYLFLHDLIMNVLLMAACAATTAVGYIGKYGNSHTGWIAICDHFPKFCNRVTTAATMSYLGFIVYFILTIISAKQSRQIGA